jgi:hypothetical protein
MVSLHIWFSKEKPDYKNKMTHNFVYLRTRLGAVGGYYPPMVSPNLWQLKIVILNILSLFGI